MSRGDSRGGLLTTDRPTAENPGQKFVVDGRRGLGQSSLRRADQIHVVAHVYVAVGHRGRYGSVIVVLACCCCGHPSVYSGKPDFTTGKRQASCYEGRYVVHVGALEGQVAA